MSTVEFVQKKAVHKITHEFLPNRNLEKLPWSDGLAELESLLRFHLTYKGRSGTIHSGYELLERASSPNLPILFCFVFNQEYSDVRIIPYPEQYESGNKLAPRLIFATTEELVAAWPGNVATVIAEMAKDDHNNGKNRVLVMQANIGKDRAYKQFVVGHLFTGFSPTEETILRPLLSWINQVRKELDSPGSSSAPRRF